MATLIARHRERRLLDEALGSSEPELVAVYGRRRVGKTFLIREVCADPRLFRFVHAASRCNRAFCLFE